MRRPLVLTALVVCLLNPGAAAAQAAPSPNPSATPTPTAPHEDCGVTLGGFTNPIPAWGLDGKGGVTLTATVHSSSPAREVWLGGYTRPGTQHREFGRTTADADGTARFTLPVNGSTRVTAIAAGCPFADTEIVHVQDRMGSLTAYREAPRRYVFSTFWAGPAGKVVSLYRVTADGRSVLAMQTRTGGEWLTFRRTFTGSGAFAFFAATGTDVNSVGTRTTSRYTVIH